MSGRSWFVAVGDKQEGPYSEEEFRDLIARGNVRPDTYVWADGMPAWQFAGDIPGLLSSGRAPPAMPRQGVSVPVNGDQSGRSFSIDFSIWEMLGRALVLLIGFLFVVPAPWVAASFYGWVISRIQVPGRGQLGFSGKPLDIWYVFVGMALMIYVGFTGIPYIDFCRFRFRRICPGSRCGGLWPMSRRMAAHCSLVLKAARGSISAGTFCWRYPSSPSSAGHGCSQPGCDGPAPTLPAHGAPFRSTRPDWKRCGERSCSPSARC